MDGKYCEAILVFLTVGKEEVKEFVYNNSKIPYLENEILFYFYMKACPPSFVICLGIDEVSIQILPFKKEKNKSSFHHCYSYYLALTQWNQSSLLF